ncbi:MAG: beta-ketoacyl-[acyl-carrier-protein] synthase family protein [Candidatus Sulfotelmatobacter sp.]|jgi:nodulation protein E
MSTRRVAVTGLGVICALGNNTSETWNAVCEGRSGIAPIHSIDVSKLRFRYGAQVCRYDPSKYFEADYARLLDPFSQFAIIAAREAVKDSGITLTPALCEKAAIVTGSGMGGQSTQDVGFAKLYQSNQGRVDPLIIPRAMANAGASHISMEFGITGPAYTISTACCSANHAIGQAFWMVRNGIVELAIAGGSEAPFSFGLLKAWEAMRVISPDTCRPFSKDRRGLILGEGGAMLILEPLAAARARKARIHAEVVGFGMSSDAHHLTHLSIDGPVRAMRAALLGARLRPEQVGYINAHGSGTLVNDPLETRAIRELFGAHAERLAVSSTKSLHGHALGATGAMEAVCTVLALENGLLPPTANFTVPDPNCNLDVVPNRARPAQVEFALSNSFAFGGLNAVLAFRGPDN